MIEVIGYKRVVVLGVLVAANLLLAALVYLYLSPKQSNMDMEMRQLRSKINVVENDIRRMQLEFEQLDKQQVMFDELKEQGFFSTQDRSDAKKIFSDIQVQSQVVSAVVSVRSGVIEENQEAQKAKHKVLKSPIDVKIKAFDDSDILKYIDLAKKNLPGHLSLSYIKIKRDRDINPAVLRTIMSGASPELISAEIIMFWRTLIPEELASRGAVQ